MQRLTFGTDGTSGPLRCAKDHAHPLQIVRSDDRLIGWCRTCFDFAAPGYDVLGSLAWYDDHDNLWLLFDWLGDMSASGFRDVVEKPWHYDEEFAAATAARAHEDETRAEKSVPLLGLIKYSHEINKSGDTWAYCNDCPWEFRDGLVGERDPEPDCDPEPFDMSGSTRGVER